MATERRIFASIGRLSICAAASAAAMSAAQAGADGKGAGAQWLMGGADLSNSRNQTNTTITPTNVGSLTFKWKFPAGGDVSATPLVVYSSSLGVNVVYFPDLAGNFYAVNGTTGQLIWSQKVSSWTGIAGDYARNDPAYYTGNNGNGVGGHAEIILGNEAGTLSQFSGGVLQGPGAWVIAVDPDTGALIWKTQVEKFPASVVTSSPVIYKGTVYVGVAGFEEFLTAVYSDYPCCTSRGSVVALDAKKGSLLWQTYMVPNNNGLTGNYAGASVWGSTPVVDANRNSVYVATGNNFSVPQSVKDCIAATPNNAGCSAPTNYFDSIVALNMSTGAVKWADRAMYYDNSTYVCAFVPPGVGLCPSPEGPDYDFGGAGPNLLTTSNGRQLVGAGEKSGVYYAVNPDTGAIVWKTNVGPGSLLGGIEWGTAADSANVYVPIVNYFGKTYSLRPTGTQITGGSWSALDPTTGAIKWQTATPGGCTSPQVLNPPSEQKPATPANCFALGPPSAAGGVLFAGSMDKTSGNPTMFALNGATGQILWSYAPGATVNAGPAIVGSWVYWGAGYGRLPIGSSGNALYAFSLSSP